MMNDLTAVHRHSASAVHLPISFQGSFIDAVQHGGHRALSVLIRWTHVYMHVNSPIKCHPLSVNIVHDDLLTFEVMT